MGKCAFYSPILMIGNTQDECDAGSGCHKSTVRCFKAMRRASTPAGRPEPSHMNWQSNGSLPKQVSLIQEVELGMAFLERRNNAKFFQESDTGVKCPSVASHALISQL